MLVVQDLSRKGLHINLKSFFSLRTAEKVAQTIQQQSDRTEVVEMTTKTPRIANYTTLLSAQQKRMWFLAKLHPNRDSYVIRLTVEMKGRLEMARFVSAFHSVIMVNTASRSFIGYDDSEAVLIRQSGTECFHELLNVDVEDPQIEGHSLIAAALRENANGHALELRIHHIISDGRSLAVFGEELAAAYNGKRLGTKRNYSDNPESPESLQFWREYLADFEPCSMPQNAEVGAIDGEAGYIDVDLSFLEKLCIDNFCSTYHCTLYHVLIMAYIQTMRMTYDIDDIIVGTTVANRTPNNMDVVGLFVNTIPLRFNKEFPEIAEQLSYTKEQVLSATEHQSTPLAEIIKEVVNDRDTTKTPLFQHVVTYESASLYELPEMEGLSTKCSTPRTFFAQFVQSWIFHPGETLLLSIQYDKGHCSAREVAALASLFKRTLKGYLTHQKFYTVCEHTRGLFHNEIYMDTPRNKTLGLIFAKQSLLTHSLNCLESKQHQNYGEVYGMALDVGRRIQSHAVISYGTTLVQDDIICIVFNESLENHIIIEAVHLLGCAYLCISPETPSERMRFITEDCLPKVVVTNQNLCSLSVPVLDVSKLIKSDTQRKSKPSLLLRGSSDSLAYIIYTSGTTGTPKGVCVNHQSAINMLEHATRKYAFRPKARVLQFTKSSFDASISNTFGALLNGGVLCIRDEEADVVQDLQSHQPIAVLHMTPIVMSMFDEDDLARLGDVERWSFGGETISAHTLKFMLERGNRLTQLYGPTEVTCYQTLLEMKAGHAPSCLGTPISKLVYGFCSFRGPLLQRNRKGQFFCSGENLARGYIGRSTNNFISNPFRSRKDCVLGRNPTIYLTGDRLFYDETGYLHFLGREDDQVKVKGHRIQLSEIESLVMKQTGAENCVCVIQKDKAAAKHIVMYYTGSREEKKYLEDTLSRRLPKYMIPSAVIRLEQLPMTRNGKIDRRELSRRRDITAHEDLAVEPQSHMEEAVLKCFSHVLKRGDVDVNSDFFLFGGHSLLAVRVADELEKSAKVPVSVLDIFTFSNVRDLAKHLAAKTDLRDDGFHENPPLEDRPTPLQVTLLRSFRNKQTKSLYDIPLKVVLRKAVDPYTIERVMNNLVMVCPSLRTRFARSGRTFALEVLSGTECYQSVLQAEIGFADPFEQPPFVFSFKSNHLSIMLNHIITDGHSMRLIAQSMQELLKGMHVKTDDGMLLHSWLLKQWENRETENREFWRKTLRNLVYNQLPTVRARVVDSFSSRAAVFEFRSPKMWSEVGRWTRMYKCTPFVVLLTLFSRLFQSLSYNPLQPVPVGFPVNLRNQDMHSSVGYGISTVVVAQDTNTTFADALRGVMTKVAEAMSHALFPYDEMVDLTPSKKLFGIMLVLDTYSVYESDIFKVELTPPSTTKFELSIFATPAEDVIKVEYNAELYDEVFLSRVAASFNELISDWDHVPSTSKCRSFESGGCLYDTCDIEKVLRPLKISNISVVVTGSGDLRLFCSNENGEKESVRNLLQSLPPPLRPKEITVEPEDKFEYPLSKQQMQMYFLSLQNADAHVLPFLKKFPKKVQTKHLHQALLCAIQRHEMLRATIFERHGDPKQTLLSMTEAYVPLVVESSTNLRSNIDERLNCTLVLHHRPLLEAVLFETSESFVALLKLHHIISDAWSTGILEREIEEFVATAERGDVPAVYRQNFTYMQYCKTNEAEASSDEKYIDELLSAQKIDVSQFKEKIAVWRFDVSQETAHFWSKQQGISLFVGMLRLLSESIMEQFELSNVNIGCPHANRSTKTKSIFGYFLNNVVFHIEGCKFGVDPFTDLQRHVSDVLKKNPPYTDLVAHVRRKGAVDSLFQVYFNCRYDLEYDIDDDDELLSLLPIRTEFPLEVDLDKRLDNYRLTFRIQDSISPKTGKELVDRFHRKMLGEPVERSKIIIDREMIHTTAELLTVLRVARDVLGMNSLTADDNFFTAGGNSLQAIEFAEKLEEELDTNVDMSCIYETTSFGELANRLEASRPTTIFGLQNANPCASKTHLNSNDTPSRSLQVACESYKQQRIASKQCEVPLSSLSCLITKFFLYHKSNVAFLEPSDTSADYGNVMSSLHSQAFMIRNKFAQINGVTVSADTVIPVIGRRSVPTISTCLSVIVAGAAYLPIDLGIPTARIKALLRESRASCYIGPAIREVSMPNLHFQAETKGGRQSRSINECCDLAYLIHTSGTTGTPKGTCIKHEAVTNMMLAATQDFRMHSDDVVYQFTNFVYDNSVLEIFMALSNGARLVVDTKLFSPSRFTALIEEFSITHCLLFPGVVASFRDESLKRLLLLRYWIVGAEKLPQTLFDRAIEYGICIIQNYGPTETTAYALTKHMRRLDNSRNLGRPISNAEVIVEENGALLIRGAGTMRGYLNKDASAAFRTVGGERFYESGDYVHLLSNNDIVFVGRKDNQVKIRGHRVELGEIESTISELLCVRQCKVLWEENARSLLAFCTLQSGTSLTPSEVLRHCSGHLPKHAVPDKVIFLEEFPLTANSKIDVDQLRSKLGKCDEKSALVNIAEAVLGHSIDAGLSLFENGGTTWHGISTASTYLQKYGETLSVAALLLFPLTDEISSKIHTSKRNGMVNGHVESSKISDRLRKVWLKVLKHDDFDVNDSFFLVGGHSLLLLKLRYELNKEFHTEIALQELLGALKFDAMSEMLLTKETPLKVVTVVNDPPAPRKVLVFIHPLYGGTVPYVNLIQSILKYGKYRILCVQHPNSYGYNTGQSRFFESIHSLGRSYAQEIDENVTGHKEVVLVGASFGGTMALEISKHLNVQCDVIAIDSGTDYSIRKYTVQEHIKVRFQFGYSLQTNKKG
ncbi:AMP-binding enzyme [Oesophagostomum dentatum]|uniref:Fatty acid synthase n=1 Tax=Oesophagostomum dentatum TaxID=61180 RepID=A0A0B1TKL1_OESDE|nr:AMP-binding enzyme [Oesophagostomum dentatum]